MMLHGFDPETLTWESASEVRASSQLNWAHRTRQIFQEPTLEIFATTELRPVRLLVSYVSI